MNSDICLVVGRRRAVSVCPHRMYRIELALSDISCVWRGSVPCGLVGPYFVPAVGQEMCRNLCGLVVHPMVRQQLGGCLVTRKSIA